MSGLFAWFERRGWTPWPFQAEAREAYRRGESGLIQVATGAGKTYAAYAGPLDQLIAAATGGPGAPGAAIGPGLRVLYVTPLRAVSRDIELALRQPIGDLGLPIIVESRTGDTKSSVRARQRERLPHVLITTPESLTLLLTRENAHELFQTLSSVIVDEWHELLASKRGTQVELALTRLRGISPTLRVWGLSATLPNLDEAASALVGTGRAARVIRADMDRPVVIDSVLPSDGTRLPWAGHLGLVMLPDVVAQIDPGVPTLLFTNTRSQAERWFHALAAVRPEWASDMALHHGSIDREERERVEGGLKDGSIRLVVATSSLDLGVDFAPVERVFQIGSPKGIARLVQRAGRSSHRPRTPCRVTCVPTHALELIEIAAARSALLAGRVEPRTSIDKPLDVLAQHLVTRALGGGFEPDALFEEVRQAWSYRTLTRQEFDWALALVKNGGGTLAAYPDYHRVAEKDGAHRVVSPRIAQLHRLNVGTICGDGTIDIRYLSGRSLGRIEEHFVAGLREGQRFVFAGKVLRFAMLQDLVAYVRPATGTSALTPIWAGTRLPISESLSSAMRDTLERCATDPAGCDRTPELAAAGKLIATQARVSCVPRQDETLLEIARTQEGTHLFVFPFEGRLVHAGLAALIAMRLARRRSATFALAANDYGLEVLCADEYPFATLVDDPLFDDARLFEDIVESVNMSQLAKLQFREVARVSGLVFQTYPGAHKSSRQVQASSGLLFDVLSEFDPENLLLAQAKREVMERQHEHGRLARALWRLRNGPRRTVETGRPSPLAFPLLIERQAARLSTETILERVQKMQKEWEDAWTAPGSTKEQMQASPRGALKSVSGPSPAPTEVHTPTRRRARASS